MLERFDDQLRGVWRGPLPSGVEVERDGPLLCVSGIQGGGFVEYRHLGGLDGPDLDELISRCVHRFAERGLPFEWKTYGHDAPPDLSERLVAAGLGPQEPETVLIAEAAAVAGEVRLPAEVALREVTARADLERVEAFGELIWPDAANWLADMLEAELAADPASLTVVVAEANGEIVCRCWVRFVTGTDFATFWGGSTQPEWRSRGIYRATVAYRANLAVTRGFRYLQVDASEESRPILERLGFVAVTTTTPYMWTPDRPPA